MSYYTVERSVVVGLTQWLIRVYDASPQTYRYPIRIVDLSMRERALKPLSIRFRILKGSLQPQMVEPPWNKVILELVQRFSTRRTPIVIASTYSSRDICRSGSTTAAIQVKMEVGKAKGIEQIRSARIICHVFRLPAYHLGPSRLDYAVCPSFRYPLSLVQYDIMLSLTAHQRILFVD